MEGNQDNGNGDGNSPAPWPSSSQTYQQAVSSTFTSSPQNFITSQASIASYAGLGDGQFATLTPATFQHLYATPTSSYERVSPVDEYSAAPSGSADLQAFRGLGTDGQILRLATQPIVTVLLGSQGHGSQLQTLTSSLGLGPIPSSSAAALSASLVGLDNHAAHATLEHHRDHSVDHLVAPSDPSHHLPVSQAAGSPLLQVLQPAESTTSEAAALVVSSGQEPDQSVASLSLLHAQVSQASVDNKAALVVSTNHHEPDQGVASLGLLHAHVSQAPVDAKPNLSAESYATEPDTTQDDGPPQFHQVSHVGESNEAFAEPSSSHMDLATGRGMGLSSGLDGDVGAIDSTLDSTVDDATLVSQPMSHAMAHHLHMDPGPSHHMSHPPPGSESDIEQMLASAPQPSHLPPHMGQVDEVDTDDDDQSEEETKAHLNLANQLNALRKSQRLANQGHLMTMSKPRYISRPFNPRELWCEDCQCTYPGECPSHRLQVVFDKVVLSRAWASLPPQLQIFRLGETSDLGVFAKRPIPQRTQFGPYIGELVPTKDQLTSMKFVLQVEKDTGEIAFIESSDENRCNWMMFVRPADNYAEQNLVVYQYGSDIYFATIKDVEPKQELKIWYSSNYAEWMGVAIHTSEEDLEQGSGLDLRWPCYECNKKFRSSALLQKHLNVHDDTTNYCDDDDSNSMDSRTGLRYRRKGPVGRFGKRSRGRPAKPKEPAEGSTFQSWKKKKTSIYLNKYKKYHQDTLKRSIKSLYKRKGKASGGNEWVCTHCDLTFDNASLLNLHTLTHAAEDVGLTEIRRFTGDVTDDHSLGLPDSADDLQVTHGVEDILSLGPLFNCPVCHLEFESKRQLIQHASEHGKAKRRSVNPAKPHKCTRCWKAFSHQDRLQKHMLCHGDENSKPLACHVCAKRFMNNSALACHLKTHSDQKYYDCPLCRTGFDQILALKEHVRTHMVNGVFTCPECHRSFHDYNHIRKHMRAFHSERKYPCQDCGKVFPRPDKLKLHMLRHSSHREFMCETCGRQFKRKDKLKEHTKRMHSADREARMIIRAPKLASGKKFVPKVSPNDYHRFIYKCHTCLLGFKRRGMLVNHLAKRHPDVKPDSVPELNLPILKTQKDYYCQYCEKVYKSSSKRKAHIIKNHPGADLPASSRKKEFIEVPGLPNPTFSQTVGSVTTVPHPCEYCHKQYASKAKLLQHQRKKHIDLVPALPERRRPHPMKITLPQQAVQPATQTILVPVTGPDAARFVEAAAANIEVVASAQQQPGQPQTPQQADTLQAADLLTQAMSELTQTLSEYRSQGEYQLARLGPATPSGMVQNSAASTIELSHLGPTLAHTQFTTQPAQTPSTQSLSPPLPNPTTPTSTTANVAYIPRSWTATVTYPTYR